MTGLILIIAEWALIAIIGICGTLGFSFSSVYSLLEKLLISHYPDIGHYLIAIVWGFLALVGVFTVSFQRKGGGRFTWLAIIFSAPSILAFNKLDIFRMVGLNFELTTDLSFWQVLILTFEIITAYLLLNFMREMKLFRISLFQKGSDAADNDNVTKKSHQVLLAAIIIAMLLTALISYAAVKLESFILPYLSNLPWNIVLIGMACLLVVAIYIYWLGTHQSSSEK